MARTDPRTESIFWAALAVESTEERAQLLDRACGVDRQLKALVEELLAAYPKVERFLEPPSTDRGVPVEQRLRTDGPAAFVGSYKLLQEIGEGGMGTVYMAEQERPVRRRVALKLVKAGLDSRQVQARFEAERQALALMDHPNIARVLDAGATEQGRPYFVMELVKGIPITQFCDERRLTPRERLELAIPVCQAVQHAHQKGVIHRDLKPSNVLVALYDGQPVPKVIDFGVAKATGPRLTEHTLYTEFGAVVGTLEYMSPEQAQLNQLDIDTRSDIYSLGVLLYELLTGTTPLQRERLKDGALLELLRAIREDESPRPSRRLSTTEELPAIAACRNVEPRKLSGLVRGELDWIVMKALEKDRNRRYEAASGLAADLRRYLDDEPVQAGPPSPIYRSLKFVRRHQRAMATAALLAVMLFAAIGILAISNVRIARKQEELESHLYVSHIALAERELAVNHGARAEEILDQCPAGRRGWEWHFLRRRMHEEPLVLPGHTKAVKGLAFTPDGRVLASASNDGTVGFWDTKNGNLIDRLHLAGAHPSYSKFAFSPDGQRLAADGPHGSVTVWDLILNQSRSLKGNSERVEDVAFSPDGRHLAAACEDGTVTVWDLNRDQKRLFSRHGDVVHGVAYSPDGIHLASASEDRTVRIWDVRTGQRLCDLTGHQSGVLAVVFSPDGQFLAAGSRDGTVRIWATTTGSLTRELRGHTDGVDTLAFSPDGRRLVSAGWDTTVRFWDPLTGQEAVTLRDHTLPVYSIAFTRDGWHMASGGYVQGDPGLRIFSAKPLAAADSPEPIGVFAENAEAVNSVAFSLSGNLLASAGNDKIIRVRDLSTGRLKHLLDGGNPVNDLDFSPDETHLAACDDNGFVRAWDVQTGQDVFKRRVSIYSPQELSYSPDGGRLAVAVVAVPGECLPILDARTGKDSLALGSQLTFATTATFSPDGRHVASSSTDNIVRIWDTTTGEVRTLPAREASINSLAYHPNGRSLAAAGDDGVVILWDLATDRVVRSLRAHHDAVNRVRFSPDGGRLVTASRDGTVKCWDTTTGNLLALFRAHRRGARDVAFHRDGRRLASAGADGTVKLWAVPASRGPADPAG